MNSVQTDISFSERNEYFQSTKLVLEKEFSNMTEAKPKDFEQIVISKRLSLIQLSTETVENEMNEPKDIYTDVNNDCIQESLLGEEHLNDQSGALEIEKEITEPLQNDSIDNNISERKDSTGLQYVNDNPATKSGYDNESLGNQSRNSTETKSKRESKQNGNKKGEMQNNSMKSNNFQQKSSKIILLNSKLKNVSETSQINNKDWKSPTETVKIVPKETPEKANRIDDKEIKVKVTSKEKLELPGDDVRIPNTEINEMGEIPEKTYEKDSKSNSFSNEENFVKNSANPSEKTENESDNRVLQKIVNFETKVINKVMKRKRNSERDLESEDHNEILEKRNQEDARENEIELNPEEENNEGKTETHDMKYVLRGTQDIDDKKSEGINTIIEDDNVESEEIPNEALVVDSIPTKGNVIAKQLEISDENKSPLHEFQDSKRLTKPNEILPRQTESKESNEDKRRNYHDLVEYKISKYMSTKDIKELITEENLYKEEKNTVSETTEIMNNESKEEKHESKLQKDYENLTTPVDEIDNNFQYLEVIDDDLENHIPERNEKLGKDRKDNEEEYYEKTESPNFLTEEDVDNANYDYRDINTEFIISIIDDIINNIIEGNPPFRHNEENVVTTEKEIKHIDPMLLKHGGYFNVKKYNNSILDFRSLYSVRQDQKMSAIEKLKKQNSTPLLPYKKKISNFESPLNRNKKSLLEKPERNDKSDERLKNKLSKQKEMKLYQKRTSLDIEKKNKDFAIFRKFSLISSKSKRDSVTSNSIDSRRVSDNKIKNDYKWSLTTDTVLGNRKRDDVEIPETFLEKELEETENNLDINYVDQLELDGVPEKESESTKISLNQDSPKMKEALNDMDSMEIKGDKDLMLEDSSNEKSKFDENENHLSENLNERLCLHKPPPDTVLIPRPFSATSLPNKSEVIQRFSSTTNLSLAKSLPETFSSKDNLNKQNEENEQKPEEKKLDNQNLYRETDSSFNQPIEHDGPIPCEIKGNEFEHDDPILYDVKGNEFEHDDPTPCEVKSKVNDPENSLINNTEEGKITNCAFQNDKDVLPEEKDNSNNNNAPVSGDIESEYVLEDWNDDISFSKEIGHLVESSETSDENQEIESYEVRSLEEGKGKAIDINEYGTYAENVSRSSSMSTVTIESADRVSRRNDESGYSNVDESDTWSLNPPECENDKNKDDEQEEILISEKKEPQHTNITAKTETLKPWDIKLQLRQKIKTPNYQPMPCEEYINQFFPTENELKKEIFNIPKTAKKKINLEVKKMISKPKASEEFKQTKNSQESHKQKSNKNKFLETNLDRIENGKTQTNFRDKTAKLQVSSSDELEFRRIKSNIEHLKIQIEKNKRQQKDYEPFIFNNLQPYGDTQMYERFINQKPVALLGSLSRVTAIDLCEPWKSYEMDKLILPSIKLSSPYLPQKSSKLPKKLARRAKSESDHRTLGRSDATLSNTPREPSNLTFNDTKSQNSEKKFPPTTRKVESDYQRTKSNLYRLSIKRLASVNSKTGKNNIRSALFAYLQNSPGSKRALYEVVRDYDKEKLKMSEIS